MVAVKGYNGLYELVISSIQCQMVLSMSCCHVPAHWLFWSLPPFGQQEDANTGGTTRRDLWRVRVFWLFEATTLTITRARLQLFSSAPSRLRPWLFRFCGARYSPDSQVRVNDHQYPKNLRTHWCILTPFDRLQS